jgi:membrane protease YdiL (CAAX protease family)
MLLVKPWRGEAVMQFIAAQLICYCLGLLTVGALQATGLAAFKLPEGFAAILLITLSFQGATWVFGWFFLRQHQLAVGEALGLRDPQLKRALLLAALLVLLMLPVIWLLQAASIWALTKIGWPPEQQAAVTLIGGAKSWGLRVYLGVFAVVIAPVAEEFIFRGVLFPFFKQLGLPRLAWFGVSAIFALIHLDISILVPLFVLALALTWLYEKTDNLLAPMAAHALFNAANLALLYVVEGKAGH